MNPVLLQGLHVDHCDLHQPHAGYGVQDHFVTPEVPSQKQSQVLLEGQR